MKAKDLMTREVIIAGPDWTIRQAAKALADNDIGAMPVCEGGRLMGIVTDRDIVVRAVAEGLEGRAMVTQIMTPNVEYSLESEEVGALCDRMAGRQIRRVPVVDREHHLVGMISLGDVAISSRTETSGETLEKISRPPRLH